MQISARTTGSYIAGVHCNCLYSQTSQTCIKRTSIILEDPGAVSWVGGKGATKVLSKGGRALEYRLSPDHFQKFKRMSAPDWAQKKLCITVANRRTHPLSSFRVFIHDGCCLDDGLSGSCTKEIHAVRKLSVGYKIHISKYCLPEN